MGKLIVRIASLLLIAAFLPTAVLAAEWNLEKGSIEITATANAEGGTTQTVSQGGSSAEDSNPTITSNGNQTGYTITIKAGGGTTANVTIKDTNISTGSAAIKTEGKGNVNLNVEGTNTVTSGDEHAGVEKANDGNLTIGSESGERRADRQWRGVAVLASAAAMKGAAAISPSLAGRLPPTAEVRPQASAVAF